MTSILKTTQDWSSFREIENNRYEQRVNMKLARLIGEKLDTIAKICTARLSDLID